MKITLALIEHYINNVNMGLIVYIYVFNINEMYDGIALSLTAK